MEFKIICFYLCVNLIMMKEKKLFEVWKDKMDGRTNRWLHKKTKIAESEISRLLSGKLIPTDNQISKINSILNNLNK